MKLAGVLHLKKALLDGHQAWEVPHLDLWLPARRFPLQAVRSTWPQGIPRSLVGAGVGGLDQLGEQVLARTCLQFDQSSVL